MQTNMSDRRCDRCSHDADDDCPFDKVVVNEAGRKTFQHLRSARRRFTRICGCMCFSALKMFREIRRGKLV
jgi:hypothetical protein